MELIIQSPHFTIKHELNNFVAEAVNKLSLFYGKIESANVCLKLDKSDMTNNKVCEIRLAVPGNDLFAKKRNNTFEAATDEAVEALQHQIKKMKSKVENH